MRTSRLMISLLMLWAFANPSALATDSVPGALSGLSDGWIQPPELWYQAGSQGVIFNEQPVSLPWSALIQENQISAEYRNHNASPLDPTCEAVNSNKCDANTLRTFTSVMPVCTQASDVNCIESLRAATSDSKISEANFIDYFPKKPLNAFAGDVKLRVPNGSATSIWSLPAYPHAGGNLYLVNVAVQGSISSPIIPAQINTFEMSIWPVSIIDRSICGPESKSLVNCDAGWQLGANSLYSNWWAGSEGFGSDGIHNCVAKSLNKCAQKFAFPKDVRFFVKVRTNALPAGWLHGRMTDPQISITKANGYSVLEVSALPTEVPIVAARYQWDEMPSTLRELYSTKTGAFVQDGGNISGITTVLSDLPNAPEDPHLRSYWSQPHSSGTNGIAELNAWLPYVKNTSTASSSVWRLRTLSSNEISGADLCFTDSTKVTGIVTTNATEYSSGPPSFNPADGTLNYKVSAPHFKPDGSVFKGTYDLLMTSEVARCVYKFSKAPISASIEITGEDGEVHVATTSFSEADGWVALHAKNFTYSSPILRAKLTQERAQVTLAPKDSVANKVNSPRETLLSEGTQYFLNNLKSSPDGIPFKGKDTSCVVALTKDAAIGYPQTFPSQVVRESGGVSGRITFNYQPGNYHVTFCGDVPQTVNFEIVAGSDPLNPVMAQPTKGTAPTSLIKKSITCMKGKTIKKVTAVNPKCPVGFKLK